MAGAFSCKETPVSKYRKFTAALLAAAGVFASSGLLAGTAQLVLTTVIAAVGAALVLLVPNAPSARPVLTADERRNQPGM